MNKLIEKRNQAEKDPTEMLKMFREFLSYNPISGVFLRVKSTGNQLAGSVAGTMGNNGYIRISVKGRLWRAHRLAWLFTYEVWPEDQVDHINGNRSDNRICNLRASNTRANSSNTNKTRNGIPAGVHWDKRREKWFAQILTKAGKKALGRYDSMEEAHAVYLAALTVEQASETDCSANREGSWESRRAPLHQSDIGGTHLQRL